MLALYCALIAMWVLPFKFNKYNLELVNKTEYPRKSRIYYSDLDDNGVSEKIYCRNFHGLCVAVDILNSNNELFKQWNVPHNDLLRADLIIGDYDNNNMKEIYVFSYKGDSVFLSAYEPFNNNSLHFHGFFIDKAKLYNNNIDFIIKEVGFVDNDGDGKKELIFAIIAGYNLQPRVLYSINIEKKVITKSPFAGNCARSHFTILDINNDGKLVIIGRTSAVANYKIEVPYSDNSSWLMVYKSNLEYLFDPIEYTENPTFIHPVILTTKNKNYIAVFYNYIGVRNIETPILHLYNSNGQLLKENKLYSFGIDKSYLPYSIKRKESYDLYLVNSTGSIIQFNENLEIIKEMQLDHKIGYLHDTFYDLDGDGNQELIFTSENNRLTITRNDFSHPVTLKTDFVKDNFLISSMKYNGALKPELFMQSGKCSYLLSYSKNKYYYLQYFIHLIIYLSFLLFILFIQKIQRVQLERKQKITNQIAALQLKTIKNQVEPHFTFNVINSLGSVIFREKKEVAYDYLTKFSRLIRTTLETSDQIGRSLEEEINFVKDYLDLQKFRFKNKFDYKINVHNEINQNMEIPKMILQTHVENAIKHGLLHKDKDGEISIEVSKDTSAIRLMILDNGVGRKRAAELNKDSTQKGLKIIEQFYSHINKFNRSKITQEIIDLYNKDGKPSGTKVIVRIPIDFNMKI